MDKGKNYLDYIPVRNSDYEWHIVEDDIVEIHVVNKGIFNKLAQMFLKKPKISKIKLDKYGSSVWQAIDDKSDIGLIANKVRNMFEDDENIFYERLVKFFHILKENKFITYKK